MFKTKFLDGVFGVLSLVTLGGAAAPLLAGYICDTTGSYELAIVMGATLLFIGTGLSLILKPGRECL